VFPTARVFFCTLDVKKKSQVARRPGRVDRGPIKLIERFFVPRGQTLLGCDTADGDRDIDCRQIPAGSPHGCNLRTLKPLCEFLRIADRNLDILILEINTLFMLLEKKMLISGKSFYRNLSAMFEILANHRELNGYPKRRSCRSPCGESIADKSQLENCGQRRNSVWPGFISSFRLLKSPRSPRGPKNQGGCTKFGPFVPEFGTDGTRIGAVGPYSEG